MSERVRVTSPRTTSGRRLPPPSAAHEIDAQSRRLDVRLGLQQFRQPLRSTGGAQQVAIDFRQGAERARQQAAIEDEGGDGAAADASCGHIDRALPDDPGDRAEQQEDDDCGHHCAQQDALPGGDEDALDGIAKARGLAVLLVEGLDDLHRPQHFAGDGADVGNAALAGGRNRAHTPAEQGQRNDDQRNAEQHHSGELGRKREQDRGAGDTKDQVAQRDGYGGADDLLDDGGVDRHSRGNLGRAVLLEESGREAQQVAMHRKADVGDSALAKPRDEVEADRGGERHDSDQEQQIFKPAGDVAGGTGTGGEAFVDDQLEGVGDAEVAAAATSSAKAAMAIWPRYRAAKLHTMRRFFNERPLGRVSGLVAMPFPYQGAVAASIAGSLILHCNISLPCEQRAATSFSLPGTGYIEV